MKNKMRRFEGIVLIICMCLSLMPTDVYAASSDTEAPVVKSLTIDKHDVVVGDIITVTLDVSDETGIKGNPSVAFKNGSSYQSMTLKLKENSTYQGNLTVTENFIDGEYVIAYLTLEDILGNGGMDSLPASKYPDMRFTVSGASSDTEAPVVKSLTIDKHDVVVGDVITVTLDVSDETGIKGNPSLAFKNGSSYQSMALKLKENDTYQGNLTVTENFINGEYVIAYLTLEDILGNGGMDSLPASKYPDMRFTVSGASSDTEAPVVKSLTIDKHDVVVGDIITVTLDVSDETGIKGNPSLAFKNGSSYQSMTLKLKENGTYQGNLTVTENFINGEYVIAYLTLEDMLGNGGMDSLPASKYPDMRFYVYGDDKYKDISPLDNVTVYTSNTTISSRTIQGDVYIGPNAVVTMSDVTVTGDIYVLGGLRLVGVQGKSLYASSMIMSTQLTSTYSSGMVQITGSNTFTGETIYKTNPEFDIPIRVDSVQSVDGNLYMCGAVADIADMYIGDRKVNTSNNGKFIIEDYDIGNADTVVLTWTTVFGNTITKTYSVEKIAIDADGSVNYLPNISVEDKTYCVNSVTDLLSDITAYDKEDGSLTKNITVDSSQLDVTKPGNYRVTYSVTDSKGATISKGSTVHIIQHLFKTPMFLWSDNGKECKVTFKCENDSTHTETHDMTVTSKVKRAPTCITKGTTTYTATYGTYTDSKDVQDIELNLTNHEDETEIKNAKEATCASTGYTGDMYCKSCGEKISEGKETEIKEHAYGAPIYIWAEDGKACTVTFICKNDSTHTETHDMTITSKVKEAPTCITKGTTTYTATYGTYTDSKEVQDIELNLTNHEGETEIKNAKEATCASTGYTGDTYCKSCGTKISAGMIVSKLNNHKWNNGEVTQEATGTHQKGTFIVDEKSGVTYRITKDGMSGGTVEFVRKEGAIKSVTIPETVILQGIKYNVTSIAANAFKGNRIITKVVIGKKITKIGKNAFNGCRNLKTVSIKTTKLKNKNVGSNAFKNINKKAKIKVPAKKLRDYKILLRKKGINGNNQKIKK